MNRRWSTCPTAAATATCGLPGPTVRAFVRLPSSGIPRSRWAFPCGRRRDIEIVFLLTRPGTTGLSLINRDGSGLRQLVPLGYSRELVRRRPMGVLLAGHRRHASASRRRRSKEGRRFPYGATTPSLQLRRPDGSALYFVNVLIRTNGIVDHEIRRARPENGPSDVLARVAGSRVPVNRRLLAPVLSPDGKWLTMPLTDGATSNVWVLPTNGGPMRPLTDFGDRSVVIARRVSWSPDSKFLYAAVADTDADIVLLDGLLR